MRQSLATCRKLSRTDFVFHVADGCFIESACPRRLHWEMGLSKSGSVKLRETPWFQNTPAGMCTYLCMCALFVRSQVAMIHQWKHEQRICHVPRARGFGRMVLKYLFRGVHLLPQDSWLLNCKGTQQLSRTALFPFDVTSSPCFTHHDGSN